MTQWSSDDWVTPPEIIEAVGGWRSFDLDPATPLLMPHRTARHRFTVHDDGLAQRWFGRTWLNPPYSQPLVAQFLARMAAHDRGVAMLFVRTDGRYWHEHVLRAASGLFLLLRKVKFLRPDGTRAKTGHFAPSVLCAYGVEDLDRLASLPETMGTFVPLKLPMSVLMLPPESWRDLVARLLDRGCVTVDALYRAAAAHPKARRNRHVREKIRQTLARGPFERDGIGQWRRRA